MNSAIHDYFLVTIDHSEACGRKERAKARSGGLQEWRQRLAAAALPSHPHAWATWRCFDSMKPRSVTTIGAREPWQRTSGALPLAGGATARLGGTRVQL